MDRLGIHWLLMLNSPGATRFNGSNYPRSFTDCVAALLNRGALRPAWVSSRYGLVERVRSPLAGTLRNGGGHPERR
jgi:hypothetical protein